MAFPEDGAMDGVGDHEKAGLAESHSFETSGEWWERCDVCGLARAAHTTTHAEGGGHAHPDAT
jgi:hypothetical protein